MKLAPFPLHSAQLHPLAFDAVEITGGFWRARQARNRQITIPHGYAMLEKSGTLDNLRIAAGTKQGEFRGWVFQDSDVYKWLEAALLALSQEPNAELDARVEAVIALLAAAQMPDGYLNSYFTVVKPGQRWTDLEWAHEMYCAGHLIEAGIAHKRATGKTNLFEISKKFADHIDHTFGEGKRAGMCGHPEIELALVELYRETGEARYLRLAQYFIDRRGHNTFQGLRHIGASYMQDHVPVRAATTVQGHAVRQLYLCAGATDVYLETGERALLDAMTRQWEDMNRGKMYLTGGVGARGYGEMFGEAYELPTKEAYCETCAAIASMMWNWRMLLATGEARYADLIERVLYNGFLSGIALDGAHFFYENPLRSDGNFARQEWFECACCPPNLMRTLALAGDFCATTNERGIQIHQYMQTNLKTRFGAWNLETNYPWDGKVRLTCECAGDFELALRIPGWRKRGTIKVDGGEFQARGGRYARFERAWSEGDVVDLNFPMLPRFVESHPYVDATRGCVAIERGPLVYCIEQHDQHADVNALCAVRDGHMRAEWSDIPGEGVMLIHAQGGARNLRAEWSDALYRPSASPARPEPALLTAIPYYAWANRGAGKMRVWIPLSE